MESTNPERNAKPQRAAIVSALLEGDAKDKSFFEHRERLDVIAARMTTPIRTVSVTRDDEHNVFALEIEDRSLGYPRHYEIGVDFITSGEYRTLVSAYREIEDIKFPVVVTTGEAHLGDEAPEDAPGAVEEPAPETVKAAETPPTGRSTSSRRRTARS